MSWYPTYIELAEELAELVPGLGMMCFSNSGTEAVEAAIKMGRYVSGRLAIVAFQGTFHGRTTGAASLTGEASLRSKYEPLLTSVYHVPYPSCYRCAYGQRREDCHLECFQAIERLFSFEVSPDTVGALIIEPILGEEGYYIELDDFLLKLRELCSNHGIILLVDEVHSGMGRTGNMFVWQHVPDFMLNAMTLAKGPGSGMLIGSVLARPKLMTKWEQGAHSSTFGGNPVSCAAAIATLEVIQEEKLLDNAHKMGEFVRDQLRELADRYPMIGDVRGRGLMNAIEIADSELKPASEITKAFIKRAAQLGLLVVGGGMFRKCSQFGTTNNHSRI